MTTSIPTPGSEQLPQSFMNLQLSFHDQLPSQEKEQVVQTIEGHVALLSQRYQLLSELLEGPLPSLPSPFDLSKVQRVLDLACGTGNWIAEMAQRYPAMQFLGVDASKSSIDAAQCVIGERRNVAFLTRNLNSLEGGPFLPNSFDMMHLDFTVGEITREQYPPLIQSLARLSRPGAYIVWREAELPLTSSDPCDHLEALFLGALQASGRAFSPGVFLSLGVTPWMHYWLHHAGYRLILEKRDLVDISKGTKAHKIFCDEVWAFIVRARPFLLNSDVVMPAVLEDLLTQVQIEIREKGFCGLWPVHTIVGVKRK